MPDPTPWPPPEPAARGAAADPGAAVLLGAAVRAADAFPLVPRGRTLPATSAPLVGVVEPAATAEGVRPRRRWSPLSLLVGAVAGAVAGAAGTALVLAARGGTDDLVDPTS